MRPRGAVPVVAIAAALVAGGCGDDAGSTTAAAGQVARIAPANLGDVDVPHRGTSARGDAAAAATARLAAHRALATRLARFPVVRAGAGAGEAAALDERVRLGSFWLARRDLHHFGRDFDARVAAIGAMPGARTQADTALRNLADIVVAQLPAWRALVDYNASGRMRDDGGAEGRRLLPHYIVAIDALEAATLAYVDAVAAGD